MMTQSESLISMDPPEGEKLFLLVAGWKGSNRLGFVDLIRGSKDILTADIMGDRRMGKMHLVGGYFSGHYLHEHELPSLLGLIGHLHRKRIVNRPDWIVFDTWDPGFAHMFENHMRKSNGLGPTDRVTNMMLWRLMYMSIEDVLELASRTAKKGVIVTCHVATYDEDGQESSYAVPIPVLRRTDAVFYVAEDGMTVCRKAHPRSKLLPGQTWKVEA